MKLLVTGNIGYITTEFIKEAFPECQILLLGETALKSDRRKGYRYIQCHTQRRNLKISLRLMNLRV
mgnify:FL=1